MSSLNIVDIAILLLLIMGGIMGFQSGVIKKTTSFVGLIIVVILAFSFKGILSSIFYKIFPFFSFFGHLEGLTTLNIVLYETIAFLVLLMILGLVLKILVKVTGIIEKVLKATIILSIPSKILGILVGFLEMYVYIFIILFILSLPAFNLTVFQESKYTNKILTSTPILNNYATKTVDAYKEIYDITEQLDTSNQEEINAKLLDSMLKNKVVTVNTVDELIKSDKLTVVGSDEILNKYR